MHAVYKKLPSCSPCITFSSKIQGEKRRLELFFCMSEPLNPSYISLLKCDGKTHLDIVTKKKTNSNEGSHCVTFKF